MRKDPNNAVDQTESLSKPTGSQARSRNWQIGTVILFVLLLLAIGANLFPFHSFGLQSRISGYPAIITLANLGTSSSNTILHRRGLYLAIKEYMPNVKLIVPAEHDLDEAQLYGLGRVRNVQHEAYDPEEQFTKFDITKHIEAGLNTDPDLGPGPYRIALDDNNPQSAIVLKDKDIWYIVDTALLPQSFIDTL